MAKKKQLVIKKRVVKSPPQRPAGTLKTIKQSIKPKKLVIKKKVLKLPPLPQVKQSTLKVIKKAPKKRKKK